MSQRQKYFIILFLSLIGILLNPDQCLAGKKPALIYITDFEGVSSFVKSEVSHLQEMGIEVFVIDFLDEQKNLDLAARQFQFSRLDQSQVLAKIQKVTTAIADRKDKDIDITRIGVIAESDSATHAIRLVSENPTYRAVVLRNPGLVFDKQKFDSIKAKFLFVLAEKKYEAKRLKEFQSQLKKAHIHFEIVMSKSSDRFYDLSQAKRYVASDAETYKNSFYEFIKRFITLEEATKY